MVDRTPGAEAVLGSLKRGSRKSASTGQLGINAIPGYNGHIPARTAENVHSAIPSECAKLAETARSRRGVAKSDADSERTRIWRGFDVLGNTIDRGCMSATIGTSGPDGLTQLSHEHPPACKSSSYFYNPGGHKNFRSGASIPGYCGHIPGKHAGNVFGSTFAQSNLAASGTRRRKGAESNTNWLLACEFDRAAKGHGSTDDLRRTIRTIGFHEGTRDPLNGSIGPGHKTKLPKPVRHDSHADPREWRLHEPTETYHKIRYNH
jgi:hypothetical protein